MSKRRHNKGNSEFHVHSPKLKKKKHRSYEKKAARKTKQLYRQFVEKFGEFMPGIMGER